MVCSLGVTPDGRRDSRQGIGCGKEVLKYFRNLGTGRCVSLKSASVSVLSTPGIWEMDAWIFAWHVIHAYSRRRGHMVVAVLMLPHRAHLSAAVFSTPVAMCSRGAMRGAKRWRWPMYAANARSLMV